VTKLQILHTNDIHSRFERMPAIATLIQQLREQHQGPSLVIDLGDHIDRSHVITGYRWNGKHRRNECNWL
jgi:2',3'-cyclic-nucleotide 2'-phosphodiesterase (5'-nucleotidase family)